MFPSSNKTPDCSPIAEQDLVRKSRRKLKKYQRAEERTPTKTSQKRPSQNETSPIVIPKLELSLPQEEMDQQSLIDVRNASPRVNGLIRDQGLTVPLPTRLRELKAVLLRGPSHRQPRPATPALKPLKTCDEAEIPELRDLEDGGDAGIDLAELTLMNDDDAEPEDDKTELNLLRMLWYGSPMPEGNARSS